MHPVPWVTPTAIHVAPLRGAPNRQTFASLTDRASSCLTESELNSPPAELLIALGRVLSHLKQPDKQKEAKVIGTWQSLHYPIQFLSRVPVESPDIHPWLESSGG